MGAQKRIESFFVATSIAKRPKSEADGALELTGSGAGEAESPSLILPGACNSPVIASELKQRQLQALQRNRAHANRNCAIAKQVVIRSETAGTLPALGDLIIEESWRMLLEGQLQKDYFKDLERFVQAEWSSGKLVFPPKDSIFRAFNSCPVDKVRVVILGQDPYHDLGQAQGLSFSVPQGKKLPSSLLNIYKEIEQDVGCPRSKNGNLEKWANQGVLLLNAVLTVRAHAAASHAKRGWETFTDEAVARLSNERSELCFCYGESMHRRRARLLMQRNITY